MSTKINYLGLTLLIVSILIVVAIYFWYQKSRKRYAPVTILEKDSMIAAYMDKSKRIIRNNYLTESFNYSYNIPYSFFEGLAVIRSKGN